MPEVDYSGAQYSYFSQPIFASIGSDPHKVQATLNYMGFTGIRKNQRSLRAAVDYTLPSSNQSGVFNRIGLVAHTRSSGSYINRSRLYLHYETSIPLQGNTNLSMGAHMGFYNFLIKENPSDVAGSAFVPDGNFSLGINHKKYLLYGHIHQLFNSSYVSGDVSGKLQRYYSVRGRYLFSLTEKTSLYTGLWYRHLPFQNDELYVDVYSYNQKIGLGIVYTTLQQVSPVLIVKDLGQSNNWSFAFTTHIDLQVNPVARLGTFEVGLKYNIRDGSPKHTGWPSDNK